MFSVYQKHPERGQQTIKHFDKLYIKKYFQDGIFDRKEYDSLSYLFTIYVYENRNDFLRTKTMNKIFSMIMN